MLVQSGPECIKLLPAIPEQLKAGTLKGMCTRAGVTVDIEWQLEPLTLKARFLSKSDQSVQVQVPRAFASDAISHICTIDLQAGEAIERTWSSAGKPLSTTCS
jgi:hypothetical protein